MSSNIFPSNHQGVTKREKENLTGQKGQTFWITGLSGSGKSTIAFALEKRLCEMGKMVVVLDGDKVRSGLNEDLGFTLKDRMENTRRVAEVCKLFNDTGIIALTSFISPTAEVRNLARKIIGVESFIEVFLNCPFEVCEERDVKGLYKKARLGLIPEFTGLTSPFESPKNPDIEIRTDRFPLEEAVEILLNYLLKVSEK